MKIAIFTKEGECIGSATREEVAEKDLIRGIARVLIFNDKGEVFLQKRAADKAIAPDTWDNSGGGHVDEGETHLDAAKRETKEELGIDGLDLEKNAEYYFEEENELGIMKTYNVVYRANYSGEFNFQEEEVAGGAWFDFEEVKKEAKENPDKFAPGLREVLKRI
jgi:isopentenyl-diphosphate delta-isomerase